MPGFCIKGLLQATYGQVPGLRLGANSFAPVLVAVAGLSLHRATIISGNLGMGSEDENIRHAVQALTAQATLLCQGAICKIEPSDMLNVMAPIAKAYQLEVLPEIQKIDGFTFNRALAAAFIDIVVASSDSLKGLSEWKGIESTTTRGPTTKKFNEYATLVLSQAYWFQAYHGVFNSGIESTVGYMLGALANLFKIKANNPNLEIPGLEKAVAIIEQFKSKAGQFPRVKDPIVAQAVDFFEGLGENDAAAAMQIAGTAVQQFGMQYGEYSLEVPRQQIYVEQVLGATLPPAIAQIFTLIESTVELSDPLVVHHETPASTTTEQPNKGRQGVTDRSPALAGAGSTNGTH